MKMIIVTLASLMALSQSAFATEAFEATLRSADDADKEAAVMGFLGLRDNNRGDRRRPDLGDRRPIRPGHGGGWGHGGGHNGPGHGGGWGHGGGHNGPGHGGGWGHGGGHNGPGHGGGYYPPPYNPPYYPPYNPPYYPPSNPPSYDWSDGYVCYARGRAGTYKAKDERSAARAQRQAMDKCNYYTVGCRPIGCD